jgi:hypothetical protein
MILQFNGQLEIDTDRGVIYFHDKSLGITRLRICGLGQISDQVESLDITISRSAVQDLRVVSVQQVVPDT